MNYFKKLTAVLLAAALLTGCELIYPESSDSESTSLPESFSESTSSQSSSASIPVTSTPPEDEKEPVVVYPEMKLKLSAEMEDIFKLLGDFGAFYNIFISSELHQELLNLGDYSDTINEGDGISYLRVSQGDITTYSALTEKLNDMLTENCIDETSDDIFDWFRSNENDDLYVKHRGAGGFLGYNYNRINSIEYPDNDTIMLDMSAIGEKEEWGYDEDHAEDFRIILKKTDDGLRIDKFVTDTLISSVCMFISNLGIIRYNNVYFKLDNDHELVKKMYAERGWQIQLSETEEIIKLLEDYSDFYFAMTPSDNEKYIDRSQKISIDGIGPLNNPYTAEYYKTVGLPANTLDELNEKLDGFVTEKPKNDFLEITNDKFFTVAENGDLYMSNNPFGRGLGLGMDTLYLDSIEYPDDNTILVTVTSFGDKDDWGVDEDIRKTATAKIIRTEDGLRIDEYDINIIDYFGFYKEIIYNDTAK